MATRGQGKGKKAEIIDRRAKAVPLRIAGASYRAIAAQLGVTEATAFDDVQAVLAETTTTTNAQADTLRQIEIERLDMALLAIAPQVKAGNLGAIDRWVKISESRRRLLGLDAPTKASNQNWDMSIFSDEELAQIAAGADPAAVVAGRKL